MRSHVSVELSVAASCFVSVLGTWMHTVQETNARRAGLLCISKGVILGFDESKSDKDRKVSHYMHPSLLASCIWMRFHRLRSEIVGRSCTSLHLRLEFAWSF